MSPPLCSLCMVLALCLSNSLSLESREYEDGYGYHVFPSVPGSRYKLNKNLLEWEGAELACASEGEGSHLVVINSNEEAEVVKALMAQLVGSSTEWAWVGINDEEAEGTWVTVIENGLVSATGYDKWSILEPSGDSFSNCGAVNVEALYFDDPCSFVWPSICEKPNV